jgi:hypothetical protein
MEFLNGNFSQGFWVFRVFVWFSTFIFTFYKMLFTNRLEFSCFAQFFAIILKTKETVVIYKIHQQKGL